MVIITTGYEEPAAPRFPSSSLYFRLLLLLPLFCFPLSWPPLPVLSFTRHGLILRDAAVTHLNQCRGYYGQAALVFRWICGSSNYLACALLHTLRQGFSPGDSPALFSLSCFALLCEPCGSTIKGGASTGFIHSESTVRPMPVTTRNSTKMFGWWECGCDFAFELDKNDSLIAPKHYYKRLSSITGLFISPSSEMILCQNHQTAKLSKYSYKPFHQISLVNNYQSAPQWRRLHVHTVRAGSGFPHICWAFISLGIAGSIEKDSQSLSRACTSSRPLEV